jgi:hypothetical protein
MIVYVLHDFSQVFISKINLVDQKGQKGINPPSSTNPWLVKCHRQVDDVWFNLFSSVKNHNGLDSCKLVLLIDNLSNGTDYSFDATQFSKYITGETYNFKPSIDDSQIGYNSYFNKPYKQITTQYDIDLSVFRFNFVNNGYNPNIHGPDDVNVWELTLVDNHGNNHIVTDTIVSDYIVLFPATYHFYVQLKETKEYIQPNTWITLKENDQHPLVDFVANSEVEVNIYTEYDYSNLVIMNPLIVNDHYDKSVIGPSPMYKWYVGFDVHDTHLGSPVWFGCAEAHTTANRWCLIGGVYRFLAKYLDSETVLTHSKTINITLDNEVTFNTVDFYLDTYHDFTTVALCDLQVLVNGCNANTWRCDNPDDFPSKTMLQYYIYMRSNNATDWVSFTYNDCTNTPKDKTDCNSRVNGIILFEGDYQFKYGSLPDNTQESSYLQVNNQIRLLTPNYTKTATLNFNLENINIKHPRLELYSFCGDTCPNILDEPDYVFDMSNGDKNYFINSRYYKYQIKTGEGIVLTNGEFFIYGIIHLKDRIYKSRNYLPCNVSIGIPYSKDLRYTFDGIKGDLFGFNPSQSQEYMLYGDAHNAEVSITDEDYRLKSTILNNLPGTLYLLRLYNQKGIGCFPQRLNIKPDTTYTFMCNLESINSISYQLMIEWYNMDDEVVRVDRGVVIDSNQYYDNNLVTVSPSNSVRAVLSIIRDTSNPIQIGEVSYIKNVFFGEGLPDYFETGCYFTYECPYFEINGLPSHLYYIQIDEVSEQVIGDFETLEYSNNLLDGVVSTFGHYKETSIIIPCSIKKGSMSEQLTYFDKAKQSYLMNARDKYGNILPKVLRLSYHDKLYNFHIKGGVTLDLSELYIKFNLDLEISEGRSFKYYNTPNSDGRGSVPDDYTLTPIINLNVGKGNLNVVIVDTITGSKQLIHGYNITNDGMLLIDNVKKKVYYNYKDITSDLTFYIGKLNLKGDYDLKVSGGEIINVPVYGIIK